MIEYGIKKLTACQLAKLLVVEYGERAYYWNELDPCTAEKMTERERREVSRHVDTQHARVRKLLGYYNI